VLATTHPSAVLRAKDARQAAYDALVADLRVAAEALSG
jgi:DNA polymerase